MTDTEYDLWGTESGFLSSYMGKVTDAYFGVDNKYDPNTTLLFLKFQTDDDMRPEHEERYSVGEGWKTYDGGETIEHPDQTKNPGKKINGNSQYGKMLGKLLELDCVREIADHAVEAGIKGGPFNSQAMVGTTFHMEEVTSTYTDRKTKEVKTSRKNYPDEWHGFDGEIVGRPGGNGVAPAAERQNRNGETIPGPSEETLRDLAISLAHGAWVDAVMELPGALTDSTLISQLSNPNGLYKSLVDGVELGLSTEAESPV